MISVSATLGESFIIDYINENKIKEITSELVNNIYNDINSWFKLIEIDHLDKDQPIYIIQSFDSVVSGDPVNYLTNDYHEWRSYNNLINFTKMEKDEWLDICTIELDPVLEYFE